MAATVLKGSRVPIHLWADPHEVDSIALDQLRRIAALPWCATDLEAQTAGVSSRKDAGVIDEIPGAYKDVAAVMAAQSDLVEVKARL